ncbi:Trm112 family protein [Aliihoeflea sp. PC F10.4]
MSETVSSSALQPGRSRATDPKLLELLVCPLTKGTLTYDEAKQELVSRHARLAYPIRDGIAIMLPSEARRLEESEGG